MVEAVMRSDFRAASETSLSLRRDERFQIMHLMERAGQEIAIVRNSQVSAFPLACFCALLGPSSPKILMV